MNVPLFDIRTRVEMLLTMPYLYDEGLISRLDPDHQQREVHSPLEALDTQPKTLKIEEVDRIFRDVFEMSQAVNRLTGHDGYTVAHLFWAQPGSPSLVKHQDPFDITLTCVYGRKTLEIEGERVVLDADNPSVFMPAGTWHRATNEFESIMISFGNEPFLQDKWGL
jgi:mannose-6-phosphate isomerase-like protein (cupin superfamily)